MYETNYHRASSIDDAVAQFAKGTDSRFLSGGQTLLPVMKQRLAAPSDVIDVAKIKDMIGIDVSGDTVTIRAATTHYDVAQSDAVQKAIPALAHLASMIGDPAVRHRGTIGGSLANNDPAADYPAAVLALGAVVKTNKRSIPAEDFFKGLFTTALEDGEIITAVRFPVPRRAAYMKFKQPASRFSLVGVFVAQFDAGVRVAVTGASSCVFRHAGLEAALSGSFTPQAAAAVVIDASGLNADLHASAAYRAHLAGVWCRRLVQRLAARVIQVPPQAQVGAAVADHPDAVGHRIEVDDRAWTQRHLLGQHAAGRRGAARVVDCHELSAGRQAIEFAIRRPHVDTDHLVGA